ncbi:hypothetical protein CL673_05760 [Candidatus Bathyarchaeota archaeon]|nr:hypothetical protein [Candidatus Bathyarchaeota archaeon]MDP6047821.1 DUF1844 domain-containing protein [Candidatus Bathyarchaeota archaeon]MDP7443372.1 DUF1844 domain-containing protein [Candidatus Bathyarchaeota archaeon]
MSKPDPPGNSPQSFDLTALDLDHLLGLFINILTAKAWQYMGLRLIPGKEEAEKDLVKAAAAIDSLSVMVDKLAPRLPEEDLAGLRAILTDLQINYARQS